MNELDLLIAELQKNLTVLERIRTFIGETERKELAVSGKTPATAFMMAGMIENYYSCLETLFLRISQNFENHLEEHRWHQALLDRMTLHIPGVRERVIADKTRQDLGELLKFRHFKRYYFELENDWDRIDYLLGKVNTVHPKVLEEITAFILFLEKARQA